MSIKEAEKLNTSTGHDLAVIGELNWLPSRASLLLGNLFPEETVALAGQDIRGDIQYQNP